jgi:hypothetical protein
MTSVTLLTDAKFSNLELTENLIFRNQLFMDSSKNLYVNEIVCNKITTDVLEYADTEATHGLKGANIFSPMIFNQIMNNNKHNKKTHDNNKNDESTYEDLFFTMHGSFNTFSHQTYASVIGGHLNESTGHYSTVINGEFNEAHGNYSTVIGGVENCAKGNFSTSAGRNSFAIHDDTFVWNGTNSILESTLVSQFMIGADNGLLFKLPTSTDIKTHCVPDGFACWCWDAIHNTVCLKTKQKNIFYKAFLPSLTHEIKLKLNPDDTIQLINPDDS